MTHKYSKRGAVLSLLFLPRCADPAEPMEEVALPTYVRPASANVAVTDDGILIADNELIIYKNDEASVPGFLRALARRDLKVVSYEPVFQSAQVRLPFRGSILDLRAEADSLEGDDSVARAVLHLGGGATSAWRSTSAPTR